MLIISLILRKKERIKNTREGKEKKTKEKEGRNEKEDNEKKKREKLKRGIHSKSQKNISRICTTSRASRINCRVPKVLRTA
ncbi:hypothetical protein HYV81_01225 [Candidatus Woesearchaeota archaeon]|nr:hypothetical protein [Candidatus Woesearchaeota archaeon]